MTQFVTMLPTNENQLIILKSKITMSLASLEKNFLKSYDIFTTGFLGDVFSQYHKNLIA